MTNFDANHIGMTVDGQIVLVRKQDRTINATQIVKLTHKSGKEQGSILDRLRRERKYETRCFPNRLNIWISIQRGKEFCVELGLEEKLRPLLDKESDLQSHQSDVDKCKFRALVSNDPSETTNAGEVGEVDLSLKPRAEYVEIMVDGQAVLMWEYDCSINVTQILKLTQKDRSQRDQVIKTLKKNNEVVFRPALGTRGQENTWVGIRRGKDLCVELGLAERLQPLLDHGLALQLNRSNPSQEKVRDQYLTSVRKIRLISIQSLVGPKHSLRFPANAPEKFSFIQVVNRPYSITVRKSDWRVNCTQIANKAAIEQLRRKLRRETPDSYDVIRKGSKDYQGTYVDFDVTIKWCRQLGLSDLANQFRLTRTKIERAVDVQEDRVVYSVVEDSMTIPVSSRLADSDYNRNRAVAGPSHSQESSESEDLMVTGDTKSEGWEEDDDPLEEDNDSLEEEDNDSLEEDNDSLEEDDGSLEEDDASSVDTDITQLHALRSNESDDEVSSRQSDDDTETNGDQRVKWRTSYYSYSRPRNSELKEVKIGLQAPSKTSSRYGSMTDVSHSFLWTASDG